MGLQLLEPNDFKSAVRDDKRKFPASLAAIANAANYFVGFTGIEPQDEPDGNGGFVKYDIVGGNKTDGWQFGKSTRLVDEIKSSLQINLEDGKVEVVDEAYNVLASFDLTGFNVGTINVRNSNGEIDHTINKAFIDSILAGVNTAALTKIIVDTITEVFKIDSDGRFEFTDEVQNIIAILDALGLHVNNILHNGDSWEFLDDAENIIVRINKDGLRARLLDKNGNEVLADYAATHWMANSPFFTICDSLGTNGVFAEKLAEFTSGIFDSEKNVDPTYPISEGGTRTLYNNQIHGQMRAVNMVKQGIVNPKVIFIENINDLGLVENNSGTPSDFPFMWLQDYIYPGIFDDYASVPVFSTAMLQSVDAADRKIGTAFILQYYTSAVKNLAITGQASADGNITITVGGTPYNVAVLTSDSIEDIVAKIVEIDFTDYEDEINENGISVDFTTTGVSSVAFDAGTTGITASITDGNQTIGRKTYYFFSKDPGTDWENTAKWTYYGQITLWSAYKGLIEYLKSVYPDAILYWLIPTRYSIRWTPSDPYYDSNLFYPDGSPNIDYYETTSGGSIYQMLVNLQTQVCERYGITPLDMTKHSNISLSNIERFYPEGNVHPLTAGYERWAETIFKLI